MVARCTFGPQGPAGAPQGAAGAEPSGLALQKGADGLQVVPMAMFTRECKAAEVGALAPGAFDTNLASKCRAH